MKNEAKVHTIMLSKGPLHINASKVNFITHESWIKSCQASLFNTNFHPFSYECKQIIKCVYTSTVSNNIK